MEPAVGDKHPAFAALGRVCPDRDPGIEPGANASASDSRGQKGFL